MKQVEAEGRRSVSLPAGWIPKRGFNSENPSKGGLEQEVTNCKRHLFCSRLNSDTVCQNHSIIGWFSLYSPW